MGVQVSGVYHCFRCGLSGRLRGFVPSTTRARPAPKPIPAAEKPEGYLPLWGMTGRALVTHDAQEYLRDRGILPWLVESAQIGACISGQFAGRVIVPVLSDDKESWLGWVGRTWVKVAERAYLYPSGMRRVIYNHSTLLGTQPSYVVEGVFDALAHWPHSCALLGKCSNEQLDALMEAKSPLVIVLDGDAHEEGWALAQKLRFAGKQAGSVRLPPGVDPDAVEPDVLAAAAKLSLETGEAAV
jgi:DNA primase